MYSPPFPPSGSSLHVLTAQNSKPRLARLLLEHGASVDTKAEDGKGPLWMACYKNCVESVSLIAAAAKVQGFSDIDAVAGTNIQGKTAGYTSTEHVSLEQI